MRLVKDRRWVLAASAAVVLTLAVAIPIASSVGSGAPANLVRARAEARTLLGLLRVPPGAVELSSEPKWRGHGVLGVPSYDEATPNLIDAHHWWTVPGTATQVLAYVTARLPHSAKRFVSGSGGPRPVYYMKGFSLPPVPGVLAGRVLAVSVVQLSSTRTAVRTDGEAVWITPRPPGAKVPTSVREIDVSSSRPTASWPVRVTGPPVAKIVTWINALGTAQPGAISCPILGGPTVTFVFRGPGGKAVARASGVDFDGTSGECNAIDLSIRSREQPPLLGRNFYKRVERLIGVRFEDGSMSSRRITVLDVLRADGIGKVRFGASPRAVQQALDSLLQQRGTGYQRGGSCGLDHQIKWWDQWTASGEPALTAYFRHSAFAGYQVGDPPGASVLRRQGGGWALATTRGLRVGETLSRGRRLYGAAFAISAAQGGSWRARLRFGALKGYAWGWSTDRALSWHNYVATIDAGDVGCPAASP